MKNFFTFLILVLISSVCIKAQITITADDFKSQLVIGKKITTFRDGTTKNINIGSTGESSWDFSNLNLEDQFITESKNVNGSPYSSNFSGAEYASNYEGTFAGVLSNTWVYNSIGDNLITHGTGTVANSVAGNVTTLITLDPAQIEYKLPVEYNSSWTYNGKQTIATTITIPIIGDQTTTIEQQRSKNFTVDAYGTVKMPDGKSLNALRIREENTLTGDNVNVFSVIYHIITKTGESISITLKDGVTSNAGNVEIEAISWTSGDGVDQPQITVNTPSGLTASVSDKKVTLNWIDNSDNEDGFNIERSENGSDFSQIAQQASNAIEFIDETVSEGKTYYYKVRGYKGTVFSNFSNTVEVTIPIVVTVSPPTSLVASLVENKVTLNWTDNSENEDGFKIERSENNGAFSLLSQTSSNIVEYTDATVQQGIEYKYRVLAYKGNTNSSYSNEVSAILNITAIEQIDNIPTEFSLSQNYPNPFNPSTTIKFSVKEEGKISLIVYDILGNEISSLVNNNLSSGTYSVIFNTSGLSSGTYIYKLNSKNNSIAKKMLLMK